MASKPSGSHQTSPMADSNSSANFFQTPNITPLTSKIRWSKLPAMGLSTLAYLEKL